MSQDVSGAGSSSPMAVASELLRGMALNARDGVIQPLPLGLEQDEYGAALLPSQGQPVAAVVAVDVAVAGLRALGREVPPELLDQATREASSD